MGSNMQAGSNWRLRNVLRGGCLATAAAAVLGLSSAVQAALVVNWGGDYVTANQNLQREEAVSTKEFGDDADVDDRFKRIEFSDTLPLSPVSGYTGTSDRFYGGAERWRLNNTTDNTDRLVALVENGTAADGGDTIRIASSDNGSDRHVYSAVVWNKADFPNGGDVQTLSLGSGSALRILLDNSTALSAARFVVKSGGSYYLSNFSITTEESLITLTGTPLDNALWAAYDPLASDAINGGTTLRPGVLGTMDPAAGLTYNIATSTLIDVTAVGYYQERIDNGAGTASLVVASFQAELVPEPTSLALLGMGGLLILRRRRA